MKRDNEWYGSDNWWCEYPKQISCVVAVYCLENNNEDELTIMIRINNDEDVMIVTWICFMQCMYTTALITAHSNMCGNLLRTCNFARRLNGMSFVCIRIYRFILALFLYFTRSSQQVLQYYSFVSLYLCTNIHVFLLFIALKKINTWFSWYTMSTWCINFRWKGVRKGFVPIDRVAIERKKLSKVIHLLTTIVTGKCVL
jgi:hypothetical protein